MSGTNQPNTQYLPPVPPAQHTLAAKLAALLPKLAAADQATVRQAITLVSSAQPMAYPP